MKLAWTIGGLIVGFLGSYLFKPATIMGVPTLTEWFSVEAMDIDPFRNTMIISTIVGSVLGFGIGAIVEKKA